MYVAHYSGPTIYVQRRPQTSMPGQGRGHSPPEKVTVTFPATLLAELEEIVRATGYWLSVVDFVREGTVEKLERWKREHPPKPA